MGQVGQVRQVGKTSPTYQTDQTYQTERPELYRPSAAYLNGFFAAVHEYRAAAAVSTHKLSITQ